MTAIVVTHDEHGNTQVADPGRTFALLLGDRTILADTRTELVSALIDGYETLLAGPRPVEETAWARCTFTLGVADLLAESLLSEAVSTGQLEVTDLSEDQINYLMPPERISARPFTGHWGAPVPLIALRSDYAPFTHLPAPTGNVRFLDPSNETTLIDSLVEAGIGQLMVNYPALTDGEEVNHEAVSAISRTTALG